MSDLSPQDRVKPSSALLAKAQRRMRESHLMPSTERAYLLQIRKFLEFHRETPPEKLEASSVAEYLHHLKGAPSAQRAALNAIVYLYRELLRKDLRAELKAPQHSSPLPLVLSREEVKSVLTRLAGEHHLMASLLYGSGLKVSECLQLRIKDLDLQAGTILVRNVRGLKDRVTILAKSVVPALNVQLGRSRLLYEADRRLGRPPVPVPRGLASAPSERGKQWAWQWVFPLERLPFEKARVHVPEDGLQRAVKQAVAESGIEKRASCQTLRHSFAAHLLESSYDVLIVQELLGFSDPRPVQAYMPLVERRGITVRSPLDEWSD